MSVLTNLVLEKVRSLASTEAASDFFGYDEASICRWMKGTQPIPVAALEKVFDVSKLIPKVGGVPQDQKVCILLPFYKSVTPATAFSIMSCLDRTRMSVMLNFGDAFIAHTRNQLATEFLKTTAEWALTIDDDSIIPCGNAKWFNSFTDFNLPEKFAGLNTVNRLLSHGKTLVGGLYFGRWKRGKPVYGEGHDKIDERYARSAPHDTIKPTKWIGTGCLLIHRSVFTAIEDQFPHLAPNKNGDFGNWFSSSEHDLQVASSDAMAVLSDVAVSESARIDKALKLLRDAKHRSEKNSSLGMGEDVIFSVRAAQSGHQPYVDMGLIIGHQGSFVYGPKKVGWERL